MSKKRSIRVRIIRESKEKEHCKNKNTIKDRINCEKSDDKARKEAEKRRKYREKVFSGYYDKNGSIYRLQRGIVESENQEEQSKFIDIESEDDTSELIGAQKLYFEFINSLTPAQRKEVQSIFCYKHFDLETIDRLSRASSGKLHDKK